MVGEFAVSNSVEDARALICFYFEVNRSETFLSGNAP